MTSTTAAAAALTDGEHLVHRPRPGSVVHVYRGPLTASGRYAKAGPACGQRTNRLQVLEPPTAGPLEPGWTRRLCTRCDLLLCPPAARGDRADWDVYESMTAPQLAVDLSMAVTPAEVDRVVYVALRALGPAGCTAPLRGRDSSASLAQRIHARRLQVDQVLAEQETAWARQSQEGQAQDRRARLREQAAEAQRLADRTGNSVDRLRAARAAAVADSANRPDTTVPASTRTAS